MSNITVKFIGKEYSIPEDVLTYIDLLSFTENVQQQLVSAFVSKIKNEIAKDNIGVLDDEDFSAEIEQQVSMFIAKLCDNGIFTRTIRDYLGDNAGYQFYSDVNRAALEKMKSLLMQKLDSLQEGYNDAVQRAETHVTGTGFSIWSGSFINHAIYAAMEASAINKQEKEASAMYQKEISAFCSKLESDYDKEISQYIYNEYIPNMEAAFTVLTYDLLDKYVADLIEHNKFCAEALDFVNISRSNDLLKNLPLSNNKKPILETAFAACPFNSAVYIQAMKHNFLDYESYHTAKVFKQEHHILSFFEKSWGEVSFPTKFNINYQHINVWASYIDKTPAELLRNLTDKYVKGVVSAYSRVADIISNKTIRQRIIKELGEDIILSGDSICIGKAREYIEPIVHTAIWEQLIERCGHTDLFSRIKKHFPAAENLQNKKDFDRYVVEQLAASFEETRKELVLEIEAKRAEEERQRIEREREQAELARIEAEKKAQQKATTKKIIKRVAMVTGIIVAAFIALIAAVNIYLIATDKPIDNDFAERKEYELHSLTYYVPENWEEDSEFNQSHENIKFHVRYNNWGKYLCAMAVVYSGEIQHISVEDVVSSHAADYKDAVTENKRIGQRDFTVITYVRAVDNDYCNVYVTEVEHSVFMIYFRSVPENNKAVVFDEIVGAIAFEEYVNPNEEVYDKAIQFMTDGEYQKAYDILVSLNGYRKSSELVEECLSKLYNENVAKLMAEGDYSEAYKLLASGGNAELLKDFKVIYLQSNYSSKYYDSISTYKYNSLGNLLSIVETYDDGDKQVTEYVYDENNRMIEETITDSDVFETSYTYDEEGKLLTETSKYKGVFYTYTYHYDHNGNMIKKVYTNSVEDGEKITKYEYDSIGQVTKEIFNDGTYHYYKYGSNNELIRKTYVWSDGRESVDNYYYDKNGFLIKETDHYGNSVEYIYDSNYFLIKKIEYDDDKIDEITEYSQHQVLFLPYEE